MRFPWQRKLSLILLSTALCVLGCTPPPSKVKFNNHLAEVNRGLVKDAVAFHKAIIPAGGRECDPDTANLAAAQQAYDGMVAALNKVQGQAATLELPRQSKPAEEMKAAYDEYLHAEQKILDKCKEIVAALGNGKMNKKEKQDTINKLLVDISKLETDAYRNLSEAQLAFCKAHNFKAEEKID